MPKGGMKRLYACFTKQSKQNKAKMTDLELFNKHSQPQAWAIKEIQAGRLKGKSDINPQWRIYTLTEMFGLVGFGWKYTVDRLEQRSSTNGEIAIFAQISLYVKKDVWSDAIVGTGGSMFVSNEKNGAYTSDEAEKMAITDAISVACKQLGIGGNIYSGSKYLPVIAKPAAKETLSEERFKKALEAIAEGKVTVESLTRFELTESQKNILDNSQK